mgnify:FL=1|jgi:hypothetical protein
MMHMNTPHPQQPLFADQKPVRVTVPVTPEVQEAFQRLAAASGISTGKAMGDWLKDTLEGALAMAEMLEKARAAPKQAVRQMHSYVLGLTDVTSELLADLSKRSRKGVTTAGRQAPHSAGSAGEGAPPRGEGPTARKASAAAKAPLPPRTVIRGGKSPKTPKKPKGD